MTIHATPANIEPSAIPSAILRISFIAALTSNNQHFTGRIRPIDRNSTSTPPGVARQLVTFLVLPRKVTKRNRPRFPAPAGFPALLEWSGGCGTRPGGAHKPRPTAELKQSSPKPPDQSPLLGGAQGINPQPVRRARPPHTPPKKHARSGHYFPLGFVPHPSLRVLLASPPLLSSPSIHYLGVLM